MLARCEKKLKARMIWVASPGERPFSVASRLCRAVSSPSRRKRIELCRMCSTMANTASPCWLRTVSPRIRPRRRISSRSGRSLSGISLAFMPARGHPLKIVVERLAELLGIEIGAAVFARTPDIDIELGRSDQGVVAQGATEFLVVERDARQRRARRQQAIERGHPHVEVERRLDVGRQLLGEDVENFARIDLRRDGRRILCLVIDVRRILLETTKIFGEQEDRRGEQVGLDRANAPRIGNGSDMVHTESLATTGLRG